MPAVRVAILTDDILDIPQLPASWDTTSDSIALWFSAKIQANSLILAKRVNPLEPVIPACKIRGLNWVDPQFSKLWGDSQFGRFPQVWVRHFGSEFLGEVTQQGTVNPQGTVTQQGRGLSAGGYPVVADRLWTLVERGRLG